MSLITKTLLPEDALEHQLLTQPAVLVGMMWGEPRYGHPEGKVYLHIREVLDNIDRLSISADERRQLRLVALLHDTFKYVEDRSEPRDWGKHHSVLARKYMELFCSDPAILDVIELHDEAFHAWRHVHILHKPEIGYERLHDLLWRVNDCKRLYYLFFVCDTATGDKTQAPVRWFEEVVQGIERVVL
jgi:HD domain